MEEHGSAELVERGSASHEACYLRSKDQSEISSLTYTKAEKQKNLKSNLRIFLSARRYCRQRLTGIKYRWSADYFECGEYPVKDGVVADLKHDEQTNPGYCHDAEPQP